VPVLQPVVQDQLPIVSRFDAVLLTNLHTIMRGGNVVSGRKLPPMPPFYG
jgi:hypothetical protein